jgi:hypothetical protein
LGREEWEINRGVKRHELLAVMLYFRAIHEEERPRTLLQTKIQRNSHFYFPMQTLNSSSQVKVPYESKLGWFQCRFRFCNDFYCASEPFNPQWQIVKVPPASEAA